MKFLLSDEVSLPRVRGGVFPFPLECETRYIAHVYPLGALCRGGGGSHVNRKSTFRNPGINKVVYGPRSQEYFY